MAEPSIESTLKSTYGALKNIGFVEFTTDLVKNVYDIIVQASMDQLKAFAELVKDVSKPLAQYQDSLGLGGSGAIPSTSASLLKNCENYAINVLGLTPVYNATVTTQIDSYKIDGVDFNAVNDKRNAIIADLHGYDFDKTTPAGIDPIGTIEDTTTLPAALTSGTFLAITNKTNLDKIIAIKLRTGAEDNYNLLITILKLGMQKIVVEKGMIATKLTFHVDANESTSLASSDLNIKAKSFGITGGVSGGTSKFGGRLSGGYSNSNFSVAIVNEKSSAVANMNADIVGEVRIEFRTESFPSTTPGQV